MFKGIHIQVCDELTKKGAPSVHVAKVLFPLLLLLFLLSSLSPAASLRYHNAPHLYGRNARNDYARGSDAADDHCTTKSLSLDAEDVVQGQPATFALLTVVIPPICATPPPALHHCLQPLLIVEYVLCRLCHLYSCPHPPPPISIIIPPKWLLLRSPNLSHFFILYY
jgi:hypothetical protein